MTQITSDVFVRDRQASTTERVSVTCAEEQANVSSSGAAITPDGRFVAFTETLTRMVAAGDLGRKSGRGFHTYPPPPGR
jgi:hypothetical protein